MLPASSLRAASALNLVSALQRRLVNGLAPVVLTPFEWLRDGGCHGGGIRLACTQNTVFNRASVNVSSVHYDDEPEKRLACATALSAIIHPANPRAPSVHLHVSFTELRDGTGSWRMMADLNPSLEDPVQKVRFVEALERAAPALAAAAWRQGDAYFFIPALGRHRGVAHFYLEEFFTSDFEHDRALAQRVGVAAIDTYVDMLRARPPTATEAQLAEQLAYHTLYLFQVLTLDRGTSSGLLVHDQNDLGIMASLPSFVDRALLASWESRMPGVQRELLRSIVAALPDSQPAHVTDEVRIALARAIRSHYRAHPEALALQAAATIVPSTVANQG